MKIRIRRSDGKTEEVTIAEAILIYERRRDATKDEIERLHCERRILDLQKRWQKSLKKVTRTKKLGRPASEAPTVRRKR